MTDSTPIQFRLTPDDLAVLDAACVRLDASRAAVVRALIHRHAAKLPKAEESAKSPRRISPRRKAKSV